MSEALPELLAREAAAKVYAHPENEPAFAIAVVAVRAALDEAAKTAREHEIVLDDSPFAKWTTRGGHFAEAIATAIEALKGAP